MKVAIEIDINSGFCFGVTRAISKVEEELPHDGTLYCLGDIVHNGRECKRLENMGLRTIDHEQFAALSQARVLLRAHGEPPSTYDTAQRNGIEIIDATCPVVLRLQDRIRREYNNRTDDALQIVIYGKNGHAEVMGLVGQTEGNAIVVENIEDAAKLDYTRDICLYSQTTMPIDGLHDLVRHIEGHLQEGAILRHYDTICRQVANRMIKIHEFAQKHDVILFVCGRKSSNGKALYNECKTANVRSYMLDNADEIDEKWFEACSTVGICGATSTPRWLMEQCKVRVEQLLGGDE